MVNFTRKTTFHTQASTRAQKRFFFMLDKISTKMSEMYYGEDIFSGVKSIDVYDYDHRSQEMIDNNAIGLAFFDGRIHLTFYDGPGDNWVAAMELCHNALFTMLKSRFPNSTVTDEMNNWPHLVANQPSPTVGRFSQPGETYLPSKQFTFRTIQDFFAGKPRQYMSIFWYDMGLIMRDGPDMNAMLKAGTAPVGPNVYWTVSDIQEHIANGIIPGALEEEDEHEKYVAMGTWDSQQQK